MFSVATLLIASAGCSGDDDATPTSDTNGTTSTAATTTTSRPADDDRSPSVTSTKPGDTTVDTDPTTPTTTTSPSVTTRPDQNDDLEPPPTNPPPDEPVMEVENGSATDLQSVEFCDPASLDRPAIALTWVPDGSAEQLLAVATLPDGFDSNRYTVTDRLAPDVSEAAISPIEPGGVYYWRILSRSTTGWIASEVATFSGPTCVLDQPSSP